jgi:5-formyltetrahydrofolate cyclo-ligase
MRAAMSPQQRERGALLLRARLWTWLNVTRAQASKRGQRMPAIVAAFWPLQDEPDLRPMLEQWATSNIVVVLPIIRSPQEALEFRRWTPATPLRSGLHGIQEPTQGDVLVPDVLLVPTLGYTALADRLGNGGGYYDRTLCALTSRQHPYIAIGIAWSCGELAPDYQPAPHDMRLDAILTPEAWIPQAPLAEPGAANAKPLHAYTLR